MDQSLSWIAQWLDRHHVKLETRVQAPGQDIISLFQFHAMGGSPGDVSENPVS